MEIFLCDFLRLAKSGAVNWRVLAVCAVTDPSDPDVACAAMGGASLLRGVCCMVPVLLDQVRLYFEQ